MSRTQSHVIPLVGKAVYVGMHEVLSFDAEPGSDR